MGKQDFLEKLRIALNGRVNPSAVAEHIRYYEDYINTEVRKGKTEEEVLDMLGDPRLIARTIAETNVSQTAGNRVDVFVDQEQDHSEYEKQGWLHKIWFSRIPVWLRLVLAVIVASLVMSAAFSVLSVVLPVLLPVLAVLLLVKLFRDWRQ